jgi:hypothetical protein
MKRTIELNGEEHPISFGLSTFRDFKGATGQDIIKGEATLGVDEILELFYAALKNGARLSTPKLAFDHTKDDVSDWFQSFDEVQAALALFTDSMPKVEVEGETEKKKIQTLKPVK